MKHFTLFLFAFTLATFCNAQVNLTTTVSKAYIALTDTVVFKVNIENGYITKVTLPSLLDFKVTEGPATSSQTEIKGGIEKHRGSVTYSLVPVRIGVLNIGSATITDSGKVYKTNPLVIVVVDSLEVEEEPMRIEEIVEEEPDGVPVAGDGTLYFKDGQPFLGREAFMLECVSGVEKKQKTSNMNINADGACSCMLETMVKNFTKEEYEKLSANKGDMMAAIMESKSPVFTEMVTCVTTNMDFSSVSTTTDKKKKSTKTEKTTKTKSGNFKMGDNASLEKFFVEACKGEFQNNKKYKNLNLNADAYCNCTWAKIKENGLTMNDLAELDDPNSEVFMKVITPCLGDAFGGGANGKNDFTTTKSPEDILGENATERVSLTGVMGVYKIRVKVAGIEKYFTLDSGASEVFISPDMERELLLNGKIKKADYLTSRMFVLADGKQVNCRRVKLNELVVGGYVVNNVTVAINESDDSLLLLGKSFLDKFSSWSIDNATKELVLTR